MGGSAEGQEEVVIMRSRAGHSLCYLQMDGVLYPPLPGYSSHLKQLQEFPCRPDDVWVFGYPKSGEKLVCVRYGPGVGWGWEGMGWDALKDLT